MSGTLTYSGRLTISTCWCGIVHAVPAELHDHQVRQHRDGRRQTDIYCPLGHTYILAGEGEAEVLRRQLEQSRRARSATQDLLRQEERSHAATRGHLTRQKKRIAAGVCPCCHRTFKQLARHMESKHPDYRESE